MLEPDNRALLLDELRPPPGMTLEHAVGTTFSLDLDALLYVPATFALFDARHAEAGDGAHPLAVMEALRRHADHMDVFCQAGQIALPRRYQPLLTFIEESVHTCATRQPYRIFHPKMWLLQFGSESRRAVVYRLLCLSRNLTHSSSWDTIIRLDGVPGDLPVVENRPLTDFIAGLADFSVHPLHPDREARLTALAHNLDRVTWELPSGFEDLTFLPFGLGQPAELGSYKRALVMAPFASAARLRELAHPDGEHVLISRPETLDRMPMEVLDLYTDVYTLSGAAAGEGDQSPPDEAVAERADVALGGLHAKIFILERGHKAVVITGSPNATDAAFSGNIELAIALRAPRRRCGIDAFLGRAHDGDPREEAPLLALLERYERDTPEPEPTTVAEDVLSRLAEAGRQIAAVPFRVSVDGREDDHYRLTVSTAIPLGPPAGVSVSLRPISLPAATIEAPPRGPISVVFESVSLEAITPLILVELVDTSCGEAVTVRTVVKAELIGAPPDRRERVLSAQLRTRADVIRYLFFLLADFENDPASAAVGFVDTAENCGEWDTKLPLFETMVRALARNPESLDPAARLIADLEETAEGQALLPPGLPEVWPAILAAREAVAP